MRKKDFLISLVTVFFIVVLLWATFFGISKALLAWPNILNTPYLIVPFIIVIGTILLKIIVFLWNRRRKLAILLYKRKKYTDPLKKVFVNFEDPLNKFQEALRYSDPSHRIFNVTGIGGIGKTSLLRMYRMICLEQKISIAFVDVKDEGSDPIRILKKFAQSLSEQKVVLKTFKSKLKHYNHIHNKVEKRRIEWEKIARFGLEVGKNIPGVGQTLSVLNNSSAEAAVDLIRSTLEPNDVNFYLSPEEILTQAFIEDLSLWPGKVVLILDSYEFVIPELDNYFQKLVESFLVKGSDTLIVIGGREYLKGRWLAPTLKLNIEVIEITELKKENAKELVERYYREYKKEHIGNTEAEQLVKFGRGMPLALATAVNLLCHDERSDFNVRQKEIVRDVITQITQSLSPELKSAIEICATLNAFNEDTLRVFFDTQEFVSSLVQKIINFPFINSHPLGWKIHDLLREFIILDLKSRSPGRLQEIHKKALNFFYNRLSKIENSEGTESDNWINTFVNVIYHQIHINPNEAIKTFQNKIEFHMNTYNLSLCQNLINRILRITISDVFFQFLIVYYQGLLAFRLDNWVEAKKILLGLTQKKEINDQIMGKLYLVLMEIAHKQGYIEEGLKYFKQCRRFLSQAGDKIGIASCFILGAGVYRSMGEWKEAQVMLEHSISMLEKVSGHNSELALAKLALGNIYRLKGNWERAIHFFYRSIEIYKAIGDKYRMAIAFYTLGRAFMQQGNLKKAEKIHKESLNILKKFNAKYAMGVALHNLADVYCRQRRYNEAIKIYEDTLELFQKITSNIEYARVLGSLGTVYFELKNYDKAVEYYEKCIQHKQRLNDVYGIGITSYYLGNLYKLTGKMIQALEFYKKSQNIFQKYPNSEMALRSIIGLCQIHLSLKDYHVVQNLVNQSNKGELRIQHKKENIELYTIEALKELQLGDMDKAIKSFTEAISLIINSEEEKQFTFMESIANLLKNHNNEQLHVLLDRSFELCRRLDAQKIDNIKQEFLSLLSQQ